MTTTQPSSTTDSPDLLRRGAAATVLAPVVNAVLLFATTATGAVEPFWPLAYPPVLFLTAVGAVGATVVYAALRRWSDRPERTFAVVAVAALLVSFVPDLTFVPTMPGATTAGVAVLMAMHVTTAAVCYAVLTRERLF